MKQKHFYFNKKNYFKTLAVSILLLGSCSQSEVLDEEQFSSSKDLTFTSSSNSVCDTDFTDNGFTLIKGTESYRKTIDISCSSSVTLSLDAEGKGRMESADYMRIYYEVDGGSRQTIYTKNDSFSKRSFTVEGIEGNSLKIIVDAKNSASNETHILSNVRVSSDGNGGSGNCDLPWTDNGFTLAKGTESYRKTVDISCANSVTLSLDAEGAGPMETADYMRIYYKVDGGTQKTIYTKNDSFSKRSFSEGNIQGNTLEIIVDAKNSETREVHTLSNVRVSSDGGGGGTDPDPDPDTDGSGSASAIIGGMNSDWKLNAFSGSLNIGSGSYGRSGANGLTYRDVASVSDNNNWFFDNSGYAVFKCHVGNPSSNNSGNMRSELRELNGNGNEIEWDGTTGTTHRMKYKVQIRQLPSSGKVAFGQIHGQGSFDDVIRVQLEDPNANRDANNGAGSGTFNVTIKGYVTEVLDRDNRNKAWSTMQMDREYDVEITMRNEEVKVYINGNNIYTSMKVDSDKNYFKAGAYLQSAQFDKSPQLKRHINNFGEVWIKNISVNH